MAQTLISISGTAAIRPASKLSSDASIRSASNRTGVSNRKPALTTASFAGAAASVGSTCWKNSPQARKAVQAAIDAARFELEAAA